MKEMRASGMVHAAPRGIKKGKDSSAKNTLGEENFPRRIPAIPTAPSIVIPLTPPAPPLQSFLMSNLTIQRVTTARQKKQFLHFPWTLYQNDPNWISAAAGQPQKEMVG